MEIRGAARYGISSGTCPRCPCSGFSSVRARLRTPFTMSLVSDEPRKPSSTNGLGRWTLSRRLLLEGLYGTYVRYVGYRVERPRKNEGAAFLVGVERRTLNDDDGGGGGGRGMQVGPRNAACFFRRRCDYKTTTQSRQLNELSATEQHG